ncbi:SPOR domain-containing protein [Alcanivorax sp. 1008]|uniref:SPOR domain-containing protein n=1 Tax=Alcanivorax sp. 1008 TaxID=2816853 RepID=UPI001D834066|nr:SPOR domain-containing protein [Alcanivorax sp. 1008]MCC1495756.1 SPOR domain-containing protein [Alcanivorax sp. 1008]
MDDLLTTDELVDQLTSESMAGRMVLLVGADPEAVSERLGLSVEKLIDFGVELLRFDALQFHTADSLLAELADVLGIDSEHVMVGLKVRGQTGNPLLMVVDNAECLAADARALLRALATQTESGLGVIFGGEPDAESALLDAGVPLSLVLESAEEAAIEVPPPAGSNMPTQEKSSLGGLMIPWRHLAAVAGLLLLVLLFWPDNETAPPGHDVRELSLPLPPPEVVSAGPSPGLPPAVEPEGAPVAPVAVQEPVASTPVVAPAEPRVQSPGSEPAEESEPAPKPTPVPPAPPVNRTPALTGMAAELAYRNEDWLLAQQAERWMLQVAAASSEDAARAMLDRLGRERSAYYRARRNGKVVFVVLAGSWASRDLALAGRDRLAAEFRQLGPFPREMRAIHSEIIAVR